MTQNPKSVEYLLDHQLNAYFEPLSRFHSSKSIQKSPVFKKLEKEINRLIADIEYGHYAAASAPKKPFYRAVAWNVERGIYAESILEMLQNHPDLKSADLLFLTETDIGMARTKNSNVARDFAKALGMNYFFSTSYLNLCKGNSVEGHYEGENTLALHGNALLSKYPITNLRSIPLKNCKDKMRGSEKRLGSQRALIADVEFPEKTVSVVVAHLDAHSSPKQRAGQMETILAALKNNPYPVLVGGDLNSSTYNASRAIYAFFGFWNKVFRGVDYVIKEHYPYPDKLFDKSLFDVFVNHGFEYQSFNETGVGTLHYNVEDLKGNHLVREVVPEWCRRIMEETLRRHGGKVSLKLDWFAGRGLKLASSHYKDASPPKVISQLKNGDIPLSDHDAILVDFDPY